MIFTTDEFLTAPSKLVLNLIHSNPIPEMLYGRNTGFMMFYVHFHVKQ